MTVFLVVGVVLAVLGLVSGWALLVLPALDVTAYSGTQLWLVFVLGFLAGYALLAALRHSFALRCRRWISLSLLILSVLTLAAIFLRGIGLWTTNDTMTIWALAGASLILGAAGWLLAAQSEP